MLGQDATGHIVAVEPHRRISWLTIEYVTEDGAKIRSTRGGLNSRELADLAHSIGRFEAGAPFEPQSVVGAAVPVRYAVGRPRLAHIRAWVPLYREFVVGQLGWLLCAGLSWVTYKFRRGKLPPR